jgi:hypothetical protein
MPLNESSRKAPRERWPLEFDLTGVPRDTRTRKNLLAEKHQEESMAQTQQSVHGVRTITENHFTVDQPSNDVFITDINNPPRKAYNPHDPKNQYPKMLYHHGNGRVLKVGNEKEEKAALKRDFKLAPSPDYDYSKVNQNSGIAAKAIHAPREESMSAEELAALDEADQGS